MSDWMKCFDDEFNFNNNPKKDKDGGTSSKKDKVKDKVSYSAIKKDEASCNTVVNVVCPSGSDQQQDDARTCSPIELIRNGGFEEAGVFDTFANWREEVEGLNVFSFGSVAYEGNISAGFSSFPSTTPNTNTARLFQNVTVTPGCFLVLSFADNFFLRGGGFESLRIRAHVYYGGENAVDLINTEIEYEGMVQQPGLGFVFHQKVADTPVPFNVSNVTVEFLVAIRDTGDPTETAWLLDGVSLRSV